MNRSDSFAPIARADARILVLGSMPGVASLQAQRYYAHPRNAFWSIMATLCGFDSAADYTTRVAAMQAAGVALWDVLASCRRAGSLDTAIEVADAQPNDLAGLYARLPRLRRVCFNGAAAATLYRRFALPLPAELEFIRLPSTSPAHAGMCLAEKLAAWQRALVSVDTFRA